MNLANIHYILLSRVFGIHLNNIYLIQIKKARLLIEIRFEYEV